ncbi:exodeoxyribonuclease VII large subunit [Gorillibacterium sp. sgz5001074]|uniref:exodeoxyribonuclease VII large subunit n=1 Tax=Gorillibacterium sp. sgz5001074 TaxID=3446695 RepID=UPI003F67026B
MAGASEPNQILSIKDLTRYIKGRLENDPRLADVWVRGEISNFTRHSSGHMYFTLKDADSRVKAIMFASQNQRLMFLPKDGTKVLARGNISVYERDGQYQMYITQMQPDGIGSLYLAYEQLKRKLELEGLFSPQSKKPIPRFPRAVGVITSPTGAAVRDIITTLQRRYPAVPILLYPVSVQGTHAAPSIVRAIEAMNELNEVDVLIVGRGGGSLEELWAFNEEIVARAIYASVLPVISAVGHETDFTIADFVADLRAATPTAAAELAVPHHLELKQQLAYETQRLYRGLQRRLQESRERLERAKRSPYLTNPRRQLLQPSERLDRLTERLRYRMTERLDRARQRKLRLEHTLASFNPRDQVLYARKRSVTAEKQLILAMHTLVRGKRAEFESRIRHLDALSPLKIMQRGYSLVYNEKQTALIKSIKQIQPGDILKVRLRDGQVDAHVWAMEEKTDG